MSSAGVWPVTLARLGLALVLAGCALKTPALPVTATAEDQRRAALCKHAARQALPGTWAIVEDVADREAAKGVPRWLTKANIGAALFAPGGLGLGWLGIHLEQQRRYTAAFDRCMIFGPAHVADTPCYQALARGGVGPAFCPRDIIGYTLAEPDSHWMVRW
jgi:hypothetical protein